MTRANVVWTLTEGWHDGPPAFVAVDDHGQIVAASLCEVCGRTGPAARVCRFEVCCSCWRGKPCNGSGRVTRKDR